MCVHWFSPLWGDTIDLAVISWKICQCGDQKKKKKSRKAPILKVLTTYCTCLCVCVPKVSLHTLSSHGDVFQFGEQTARKAQNMNACNILEVSLTFLELADSCMCKCVLVFINMWGDMTVHRAMIFFFYVLSGPFHWCQTWTYKNLARNSAKKCCALSYSICRKKVKIKRKILPRECYILFASPTAPPAPQKCKNKHFQVLQKNVLYRTALLCKILRNSIQATADTSN